MDVALAPRTPGDYHAAWYGMVPGMDTPVTLLRPEQAAERIGVSRRTLFTMMKDRRFVEPVRLGARTVRFASTDVDAWIAERMAERGHRAA